MIRKTLLAGLAVVLMAGSASAATIVGVLLDPTTTAGGGATSTRSGTGTFQIYLADDNAGSLGISSYNLTMGAAVTGSNNRAPQVNGVTDSNGDTQPAGFTLLRSATNAPAMQGSQPLPGSTGTNGLILGFGQTASNFTSYAAAQPQPAALAGTPTSGSWGQYGISDYVSATLGAKKWMFVGEGAYNGNAANILDPKQIVSVATLTAFSTGAPGYVSVATTSDIRFVPEPATASLLGLAMVGCFGLIRRRS